MENGMRKMLEECYVKQKEEELKNNLAKQKLFEQYIEFSKEVDNVTVVSKSEGTLTKDNVLVDGLYLHRGVHIIVENDRLSGFRIKDNRRVNLFTLNINRNMNGLQLYRIVGDMIHNLFRQGDQ